MTNTVINGASLTEPQGEFDLWEHAAELTSEIRDFADCLNMMAEQLAPLAKLRPDHDP
ncbi:hypothetical protein [Andreprevotia lacus]|jgi:hypothetical protein|uniref:hypothetical protein n=1 Tax=Andreprevotia lacus TaxID=1121000 RepID=UPI0015937D52|nr:hypothetical protein [Andreprevotia lacus]